MTELAQRDSDVGRQQQQGHHDKEFLIVMKTEQTREGQALAVFTLYGIFVTLIVAQIVLFCWKRKHKRSFELVTLLGLWLLPFCFAIELHNWRYVIIWILYSIITGYLLSMCVSRKISSATPRMVYTWFFTVYRISLVTGICGYITLLTEFMGLAPLFAYFGVDAAPILLLWYGLYFGILGRDCAEVASDWMQSGVMGGRRQLSIQINHCAICKKELNDRPNGSSQKDPKAERTIQLTCKHLFHEFCIRGWTLIGKKHVCPTCGEKVDLRELYMNRPWETSNLFWIKMLNAVRYLLVWNPVIFGMVHLFLHYSGIEQQLEDSTVTNLEVIEVKT